MPRSMKIPPPLGGLQEGFGNGQPTPALRATPSTEGIRKGPMNNLLRSTFDRHTLFSVPASS